MKSFKQYVKEENTQGYEGTLKLVLHRKRLTPGEKPNTPDMLKGDYGNLKKNK